MSPDDYPPQEPFTEIGGRYHAEVMRRGAGVEGVERAYGPDPYQAIAVHPADEPSGDVLMVMHGGGWTNGYKEWMAFMAPGLTARGVTTVSAGYRLAPQHVFPACFEDAADALAATYGAIAEFGGDPDRLFVSGHSAGGHLAALLATRSDWQAPRGLPSDIIKGALPISGTFWFGEDSGLSMRPRFLGPEDSGAEEAAAPIKYVASGQPPFLVAWGDGDFPHLKRQGADFAEALASAGVTVETLVLNDCDHLGASYASGDPDGIWVERATAFMRGVAKP